MKSMNYKINQEYIDYLEIIKKGYSQSKDTDAARIALKITANIILNNCVHPYNDLGKSADLGLVCTKCNTVLNKRTQESVTA